MRATATPTPPLTEAEYLACEEDGHFRYELVAGYLVKEPGPAPLHGSVAGEIYRRMATFVDGTGLGTVFVDVAFRLTREPLTIRGPDVCFLAAARVPAGVPDGYLDGAPDLAVEVVSPSNQPGAMLTKVGMYLETGARLVWVIDPRRRTAAVYRPSGEVILLGADDELDGKDVLPGLTMRVGDLIHWP